VSTSSRRYAKPGTTLITLTSAAELMGCSKWTARRWLREHIIKKLHHGRFRDFVLLERIRRHGTVSVDEPGVMSPDMREMKAQMRTLQRANESLSKAQVKLARALAKVAHHTGVRL
jgi:transposase-like protein